MKIFIGADHNGIEIKEGLIDLLEDQGHTITDCGNTKQEVQDDYPVYAQAVAEEVAKDVDARGILICGTGIGMSIAANRFKGIRAARIATVVDAELARTHNDANILCIGGKDLFAERARAMVEAFLTTDFSGEERHKRRNKLLDQ